MPILSPGLRGNMIGDLARSVDSEVNPGSSIGDAIPGECIDGSRRGLPRAEYDWSRDGLRIECKSSLMAWRIAQKRWIFEFTDVKHSQAMFDELWLVLYSPKCLYFYRHDGKLGLTSRGHNTRVDGHRIYLRGPIHVEDWSSSLASILEMLDSESNDCTRLYVMPTIDYRIEILMRRLPGNTAHHVYQYAPLGQLSPTSRALRIQQLVRCVDGMLNPHSLISDPVPGYTANGVRRHVTQAEYDWCRDGSRIECKSGQLTWDKYWGRWKAAFSKIKVARDVSPCLFDELLLALYTPRGIYIYKHDLRLGLSSCGSKSASWGHQVQLYGPNAEENWAISLDIILAKLDASGCERIAYVQW